MKMTKFNAESQRMSERVYNDLVEENENIITKVNKLLSQGYSKPQITGMLKKEHNLSNKDAGKYVDAVTVVAFTLNPEYATEIISQARLALNLTLRQAEELFESAENSKEQASALLIKLKTLQQMRNLAPQMVQVQSLQMQEEEVKRTLFDVHGIDPETVVIETHFDE